MTMLLNTASWVLILAGGFFVFVGGIGILRLPDFFTRLHAASVTDTLGVWLIIFGLMLQSGLGMTSIKLLLILVFMVFTSPTSAHALAKAALHSGLKPLVTDKEKPASKY